MAPKNANIRGYLSGMIDLKGNAYTRRNSELVLYINGVKDPAMQKDLLQWIGGGTITHSFSEGERRGCTTHCKHPHIGFKREAVKYVLTGYRAIVLLYNLEPTMHTWDKFSSPYGEAIDAADQSWKAMSPYSQARSVNGKIAKEMNALGWELP